MILDKPIGAPLYLPLSIIKRVALLPRSLKLLYAQVRFPFSGMRFAYLGEGESLLYIKRILGIDEFDKFEKIPIWQLGSIIRQTPDAEALLCVELNRLLCPRMPGARTVLTTFPWVRQRVYLAGEAYRTRRRKIEDNFGRKVRKYQYDFRVVRDAGSVELFYEQLYLPHVTTRFGNACQARRKHELKSAVKQGFLLQVLHNNQWVAGVVCTLGKNQISAMAFGHLPEGTYSLRLGGLSAAYYYLFDYAAKHSIACVDLLRSRPSSKDGVYCHKQRWGANVEKDPWPHTAIRLIYPKEMPLPEPIKNLLAWDGHEFCQIAKFA